MTIYKRRRIATVDIGSNSLLTLVAERDETGHLKVLGDFSRTPRLGEGLRATRRISPAAMERALTALRECTAKARELGAEEFAVTATAAAREAENQDEFLTKASEAAGTEVQVIPANEEARLTYVSVTMESGGDSPSMVVDIGGGSTEVTWGLGHRFDGGRSLNIGTIKLIEGPLQGDPPAPEALDQTRDEIDRQLVRVTPLGHLAHYYGTAGSFTHLAAVDLALREYDPVKIARHKLTRENVARWIDRLSRMNRREILALPGVDPRRADVLLAGSIIIERLCEKFQVPAFEVMDRGIRFGKLFDMLRGFEGPIIFSS